MNDFASLLTADGPEPKLAAELDLFGRFVGSWRVRNRYRPGPDAPWTSSDREWVFSWVAGGRGVQDVIVGNDRGDEPVVAGTTVRAYDAQLGAWRVHWFGMLHGNYCSLIARPHGGDGIRQEGFEHTPSGDVPIRWDFSDITGDSFAWDGWSWSDGASEWWLEQHMDVERVR